MAAQKGRLLLLKIGDGAGSEAFTTVAGMKTNGMTLNNQLVDITNKGSSGWREALQAAGTQSLSISGSGVFTDSTAEDTLRIQAFANTLKNYQLVLPNGDYIQGSFQVASYERTGAHDDAEQFNITLESAGVIAFTAA